MKKNADSEYYIGRYHAPRGGAPERMVKQVPVKDELKSIFLNPAYNVPLYKLVYNNAVISSYHWDWSTLKIQDEVERRMLYEMLYNVPPLFHLDAFEIEKHLDIIAAHSKVWSAWSKQIIQSEMTDFSVLSEDGMLQRAVYGPNSICVNFDSAERTVGEITLPPLPAMLQASGETTVYTPLAQ